MPLNIERIRELVADAVETGAIPPITDLQADELVAWMTPESGTSARRDSETA